MRKRNQISALILLGLVSGLVGASAAATAHPATDFYNEKWPSNNDNVEWRFDQEFPTGNKRDRVKDGAQEWNNVGQPMKFEKLAGDFASFPANSCPTEEQKDAVHWGGIDGSGGTLAQTFICTSGGNLFNFQIRLDQAENWHGGTTSPGPNEIDVWSVAAHEFGHGTGWRGHFSSTSSLCNANATDHHTMCPAYVLGTQYDRSLNTHDKHTFDNAY